MGEKLKKNAKYEPLRSRLERMERAGVKLYLNGAPSTTENILKKCIREDAVYMPDYVTDGDGKVKEIRYDRVCRR